MKSIQRHDKRLEPCVHNFHSLFKDRNFWCANSTQFRSFSFSLFLLLWLRHCFIVSICLVHPYGRFLFNGNIISFASHRIGINMLCNAFLCLLMWARKISVLQHVQQSAHTHTHKQFNNIAEEFIVKIQSIIWCVRGHVSKLTWRNIKAYHACVKCTNEQW